MTIKWNELKPKTGDIDNDMFVLSVNPANDNKKKS
jgi:hypothetical protein